MQHKFTNFQCNGFFEVVYCELHVMGMNIPVKIIYIKLFVYTIWFQDPNVPKFDVFVIKYLLSSSIWIFHAINHFKFKDFVTFCPNIMKPSRCTPPLIGISNSTKHAPIGPTICEILMRQNKQTYIHTNIETFILYI